MEQCPPLQPPQLEEPVELVLPETANPKAERRRVVSFEPHLGQGICFSPCLQSSSNLLLHFLHANS